MQNAFSVVHFLCRGVWDQHCHYCHPGASKLVLAHALDPRFKDLSCIPDEDNRKDVWDTVLEEMIRAKKQALDLAEDCNADQVVVLENAGAVEATTSKAHQHLPQKRSKMAALFQRHLAHKGKTGSRKSTVGPDDVSDAEIRRQCEGELLKYRKAPDLPVFANEEGTEWNDPLLRQKQNPCHLRQSVATCYVLSCHPRNVHPF